MKIEEKIGDYLDLYKRWEKRAKDYRFGHGIHKQYTSEFQDMVDANPSAYKKAVHFSKMVEPGISGFNASSKASNMISKGRKMFYAGDFQGAIDTWREALKYPEDSKDAEHFKRANQFLK
jgi:hypothetical protein